MSSRSNSKPASIIPSNHGDGQETPLIDFRGQAKTAYECGNIALAIQLYERALAGGLYNPNDYITLAQLYVSDGRFELAYQWFERSISGRDASTEVITCFTQTAQHLFKTEQYLQAIPWYEWLASMLNDETALSRLPCLYRSTGQLCKALEAQESLIACLGESPDQLSILSDLLFRVGQIDRGLHCEKEAHARQPDHVGAYVNYLFFLQYDPRQTRKRLFEAFCQWGKTHDTPSRSLCPRQRDRDPERILHVGYLSSDFWNHSVAYNFEAFLRERDRKATEVFGYSLVGNPDDVTEHLSAQFDRFRSVLDLDEDQLVEAIEGDEIDILVIVGGHIGETALAACLHQSVPIIVDYGSLCTTGMPQIDYRLTDCLLDPPSSQPYYLESLAYLEDGLVCYAAPKGLPEPGPLPALRNGYITFGSFNAIAKINTKTIELWAQVMQQAEKSRLIMKFVGGDDGLVIARYLDLFEQNGIDSGRVSIHGWMPHNEHFDLYRQVDIALDSFPYHGCLTTLDGLWMGVPVVSLVGETYVSRVALSILARLDMTFLAAETPETYVAKACCMINNIAALEKTRRGLRERMKHSPLCDAQRFGRQLDSAFRRMWHRYVGKI